MPTSNLHLDILMGRDETIDYEDFLNGKDDSSFFICKHDLRYIDPSLSTDSMDLHTSMEHKLKL